MGYRLSLITTFVIGIQMILGEVVVGEDAGFICPDWPLCHGALLPKLSGLVVLELVHRFTALIVSLLILSMAVVAMNKHRGNRRIVGIAWTAVLSLLVQVIVGGLIVILKLPGVTTTLDVVNSMFMLSLYVWLTSELFRLRRLQSGVKVRTDMSLAALKPSSIAFLVTVGLAILVGAIFRHTGSSEALFGFNHYLASHGQFTMPSKLTSEMMLMFHISSGMLVAFATVWFILRAHASGRLVGVAWGAALLVVLQMALGIVSLETTLGFVPVTLHWTNSSILVAFATWCVTVTVHAESVAMESESQERTDRMRIADPQSAQ